MASSVAEAQSAVNAILHELAIDSSSIERSVKVNPQLDRLSAAYEKLKEARETEITNHTNPFGVDAVNTLERHDLSKEAQLKTHHIDEDMNLAFKTQAVKLAGSNEYTYYRFCSGPEGKAVDREFMEQQLATIIAGSSSINPPPNPMPKIDNVKIISAGTPPNEIFALAGIDANNANAFFDAGMQQRIMELDNLHFKEANTTPTQPKNLAQVSPLAKCAIDAALLLESAGNAPEGSSDRIALTKAAHRAANQYKVNSTFGGPNPEDISMFLTPEQIKLANDKLDLGKDVTLPVVDKTGILPDDYQDNLAGRNDAKKGHRTAEKAEHATSFVMDKLQTAGKYFHFCLEKAKDSFTKLGHIAQEAAVEQLTGIAGLLAGKETRNQINSAVQGLVNRHVGQEIVNATEAIHQLKAPTTAANNKAAAPTHYGRQ